MLALDASAVDWTDSAGLTPLHWACTQQRHDVVDLLLQNGASTDIPDEDGRRPLHTVAFAGNVRCLSLLLPRTSQAGINVPSVDGLTPLHYAALSGSVTTVGLLIDARAGLHAVDEDGRTALAWAASEAHESVVSQLLSAKADAAVADANGMTPLHHAAKSGNLETTKRLLQGGASALQRSSGGLLAEDVARARTNGDGSLLLTLLVAAGEAEARLRQEALLADELDGGFGMPPSARGLRKKKKGRSVKPKGEGRTDAATAAAANACIAVRDEGGAVVGGAAGGAAAAGAKAACASRNKAEDCRRGVGSQTEADSSAIKGANQRAAATACAACGACSACAACGTVDKTSWRGAEARASNHSEQASCDDCGATTHGSNCCSGGGGGNGDVGCDGSAGKSSSGGSGASSSVGVGGCGIGSHVGPPCQAPPVAGDIAPLSESQLRRGQEGSFRKRTALESSAQQALSLLPPRPPSEARRTSPVRSQSQRQKPEAALRSAHATHAPAHVTVLDAAHAAATAAAEATALAIERAAARVESLKLQGQVAAQGSGQGQSKGQGKAPARGQAQSQKLTKPWSPRTETSGARSRTAAMPPPLHLPPLPPKLAEAKSAPVACSRQSSSASCSSQSGCMQSSVARSPRSRTGEDLDESVASMPAQSRAQLATPQSVTAWLQHANTEQRRALAQFLQQMSAGAEVAARAAASAASYAQHEAGKMARREPCGASSAHTTLCTASTPATSTCAAASTSAPTSASTSAALFAATSAALSASPCETLSAASCSCASPIAATAASALSGLVATDGHTAATSHADDAESGVRVGRVLMWPERVLGRGGSGSVVLQGSYAGKRAAVKVVAKHGCGRGESGAAAVKLAAREAELLNLCENENAHENVLRLFGSEEDSMHFYFALELCASSLHDVVVAASDSHKPTSQRRGLASKLGLSPAVIDKLLLPTSTQQLLSQLLAGLTHLHHLDIVHCKLRPRSVLLNSHGTLKLSGPSLCRIASAATGQDPWQSSRQAVSRDMFEAPELARPASAAAAEQAGASPAKKAADVFSAGVLIFWTLTGGNFPFSHAADRTHASSRPSDLIAAGDLGAASNFSLLDGLPEAKHLAESLAHPDVSKRLSAAQAAQHPCLWSAEQKLLFIRCFVDEPELANPQGAVALSVERLAPSLFPSGDWTTSLHPELVHVLLAHRSYQPSLARDLLRAVRNCDHLQGMPADVQRLLLPRPAGIAAYFLPRFPRLFWSLYQLAQQHWQDKSVFEPFFAWRSADCSRQSTPFDGDEAS